MDITLRSGRELQKREEYEIKLTEKEEQAKTSRENKLNITELTDEREKSMVQQDQQTKEGELKNKEEVRAYKPAIPFAGCFLWHDANN